MAGNILENRPLRLANRLENIGEFRRLRDAEAQIPCATGRELDRHGREFIRDQQGIYSPEQGIHRVVRSRTGRLANTAVKRKK